MGVRELKKESIVSRPVFCVYLQWFYLLTFEYIVQLPIFQINIKECACSSRLNEYELNVDVFVCLFYYKNKINFVRNRQIRPSNSLA